MVKKANKLRQSRKNTRKKTSRRNTRRKYSKKRISRRKYSKKTLRKNISKKKLRKSRKKYSKKKIARERISKRKTRKNRKLRRKILLGGSNEKEFKSWIYQEKNSIIIETLLNVVGFDEHYPKIYQELTKALSLVDDGDEDDDDAVFKKFWELIIPALLFFKTTKEMEDQVKKEEFLGNLEGFLVSHSLGWQIAESTKGKGPYYFNRDLGLTQWHLPQEAVVRPHRTKPGVRSSKSIMLRDEGNTDKLLAAHAMRRGDLVGDPAEAMGLSFASAFTPMKRSQNLTPAPQRWVSDDASSASSEWSYDDDEQGHAVDGHVVDQRIPHDSTPPNPTLVVAHDAPVVVHDAAEVDHAIFFYIEQLEKELKKELPHINHCATMLVKVEDLQHEQSVRGIELSPGTKREKSEFLLKKFIEKFQDPGLSALDEYRRMRDPLNVKRKTEYECSRSLHTFKGYYNSDDEVASALNSEGFTTLSVERRRRQKFMESLINLEDIFTCGMRGVDVSTHDFPLVYYVESPTYYHHIHSKRGDTYHEPKLPWKSELSDSVYPDIGGDFHVDYVPSETVMYDIFPREFPSKEVHLDADDVDQARGKIARLINDHASHGIPLRVCDWEHDCGGIHFGDSRGFDTFEPFLSDWGMDQFYLMNHEKKNFKKYNVQLAGKRTDAEDISERYKDLHSLGEVPEQKWLAKMGNKDGPAITTLNHVVEYDVDIKCARYVGYKVFETPPDATLGDETDPRVFHVFEVFSKNPSFEAYMSTTTSGEGEIVRVLNFNKDDETYTVERTKDAIRIDIHSKFHATVAEQDLLKNTTESLPGQIEVKKRLIKTLQLEFADLEKTFGPSWKEKYDRSEVLDYIKNSRIEGYGEKGNTDKLKKITDLHDKANEQGSQWSVVYGVGGFRDSLEKYIEEEQGILYGMQDELRNAGGGQKKNTVILDRLREVFDGEMKEGDDSISSPTKEFLKSVDIRVEFSDIDRRHLRFNSFSKGVVLLDYKDFKDNFHAVFSRACGEYPENTLDAFWRRQFLEGKTSKAFPYPGIRT